MSNKQIARERFIDILENAKEFYDIPDIFVSLNMRNLGVVAGTCQKISKHNYVVTLNSKILEGEEASSIIQNTIPHEIAHAVHFELQETKQTHDRRHHGFIWKQICIQLGGNGKRCHSIDAALARKSTWYKYNVDGHEKPLWIGPTRHRRIQNGIRYSITHGYRKLPIEPSFYSGETFIRETAKQEFPK